ncbi:Imm1 family immunity protein [Actinopolyspora mortivallis]|uniref:Imm1 family immunity protein n=1 Tax=Actinopolyspora mortivallis TaxID=33906 RepID=UPI0003722FB6|nr:Imm1 family immunity protein [Actinopolyspora mortivallis]
MISVFIERVPTRLVADTPGELERVLDELLSGPEDYPLGTVEDPHVIADLYPGDVTGEEDDDEQKLPVVWLHVSVQPHDSIGAIGYVWTDGTTTDSWEASASEHSPGLLYSTHSGGRFDTDTALPLDTVARAVRKFAETGTPPTCVTWRQETLV